MRRSNKFCQHCLQVFIILAFILVGCTNPPSVQTSTLPPPSQTPTSVSVAQITQTPTSADPCPSGKVLVSMDDWSNTEEAIVARDEVLAGFAAAHPCIQVEIVSQLATGADEDRLQRIKAGTASDLIAVESSYIASYTNAGGLADLTPFIQADPDFRPDEFYFQGVWKAGFYKGAPRAINKDFSTSAVYVNVGMFEKAGIPLPKEGWTYDEYLEMAKKLTLDANGNDANDPNFDPNNIVQYGTTNSYFLGQAAWFRGYQNILYSFGAHSLDPTATTTVGYLNSPQAVKAWEFSRDLIHKYHVAPDAAFLDTQEDGNMSLFKAGRLAIVGHFWGPWFMETLNATPGLKWAVVPLPTGPSGHKGVIMWMGWGLNTKTKHPQEAWQLLKWLTTEPGQRIFTRRAMTQYKPLAVEFQRVNDPFWGVFLAETEYVDIQDDTSNARFLKCVAIGPTSRLLYQVWAPGGDKIDIQTELDKLAVEADQCLASSE